MTTQPIASSRPAPSHHRRIRTTAAITAIAALIATDSYFASTTIGPDTAPPSPAAGTDVNPSVHTLRDMHQSVAGQYGSRCGAVGAAAVHARRQRRSAATDRARPPARWRRADASSARGDPGVSEQRGREVYRALQALARTDYGGNTGALLVVYAVEGFLRRVAASPYAANMTLKGGMLMAATAARRMTEDADLATVGVPTKKPRSPPW